MIIIIIIIIIITILPFVDMFPGEFSFFFYLNVYYSSGDIYVFECHQVIQQKDAFAGEEFPDCIASPPLLGGNDVILAPALADDVRPMSVLRSNTRNLSVFGSLRFYVMITIKSYGAQLRHSLQHRWN